MRILFLHRWSGVHDGGTETHVKTLMTYLCDRGHTVSLITRQGKCVSRLDRRIKVYSIPKLLGESDFSYRSLYDPRLYLFTFAFIISLLLRFVIIRILERKEFDLISVHFVTEAKAARLIRSLFRIPYSFSLEGYTDLEAAEAAHADLSFACSSEIVERCWSKFRFKPILKLHGVDLRVFNREVDPSLVRRRYSLDGKFVYLTVCRLEPRKDIPTLISVAASLLSKYDDVVFLLVGEGVQLNELTRMVEKMGIGTRFIFTGRVEESELPSHYASSQVFVLPSLYEGFGIVFAEAMASGLPIVATSVGATPEVVDGAGILVSPKDGKGLEDALESFYLDRNYLRRIGGLSFERAAENFDTAKLFPIFEEAMLNFLTKRSP